MQSSRKPWTEGLSPLEKTFKFFLWLFVAAYRTVGTTHLGGACRFYPSCSEYALEAIQIHKPHSAVWLITKRLCKCRPGGPCGHDPVPAAGDN